MKKKLFFVLTAVLVMTGCRQQGNDENNNATDFETMTVTKSDVTLEQTYPAQIEGRQSVKIIPRVEGYLREIRVKEGQRVRKGQVPFVIDQATYQAEVKAAEANVAVAKAGVETARLNYDSRQTLPIPQNQYPYLIANSVGLSKRGDCRGAFVVDRYYSHNRSLCFASSS